MLRAIAGLRADPRPAWLALILVLSAGGVGVGVVGAKLPGRAPEAQITGAFRPSGAPSTVPDVAPSPATPALPPGSQPPTTSPPAADAIAHVAPSPPGAPSRASASVPAVPARRPATRPIPDNWIASSGPLAASPPVRVDVPAVGVTAQVDPLGLNRDGTLQVPRTFSRAGWYTGRPTPGEAGPAIIVAHRSSRRGPGAFWRLPGIQPGQEIIVTRADHTQVVFVVDRLEQHPKSGFPTDAVYGPTPEAALRLITCGGPFEPALGDHYRDNVIVFAHMTARAD